MDHIVYLDSKAKELEHLENGQKSMIIRGATGRKLPYGRVNKADVLYFIENNGEGLVKAKAVVESVFNSEKLSKADSEALVEKNQAELMLNSGLKKRFAGKRYLVLIKVSNFKIIEPFSIDKSNYGNMDDWLPVQDIMTVKISG